MAPKKVSTFVTNSIDSNLNVGPFRPNFQSKKWVHTIDDFKKRNYYFIIIFK